MCTLLAAAHRCRSCLRVPGEVARLAPAGAVSHQLPVQSVVEKVAFLERQLADAQSEQALLKTQADTTQRRLERASKLTSALAEEGVRWSETAAQLQVTRSH